MRRLASRSARRSNRRTAIMTASVGSASEPSGAAAPPSAATWKIVSRNNNAGTFTTLSEVQWLDSGGVPISVSGATHTASTAQAGSAAELFDGNTSTFFQTATIVDAFVQTVFAGPVAVAGVKLTQYSSFTDRAPYFFDVYYNTGAGDTYAFSGVYSSWAGSAVTFQSPASTGAMAYWIVLPSALNGSTALTLSELQMRTSVGGTDITAGQTAISGPGTYSFGTVANLIDDDTGTLMSNSPWPTWSHFGVQFSSPQDIKEVGLQARATNLNQSPVAGTIAAGSDGRTFVRRRDFSGLTWPSDFYLNLIAV